MEILEKYITKVDEKQVKERAESAKKMSGKYDQNDLKQCFSSIDLTTLNATDKISQVEEIAKKVSNFPNAYKGLPNVAAICVYPALVNAVRKNLKDKNVKIASVTAGFPASQTFIDVKIAESVMAVENGADEIDIVISVGRFLEGDYDTVYNEIAQIKNSVGDSHVKVILEVGALKTLELIRIASLISMEAGADFIKTSTGKLYDAANPEAAQVMCDAIYDYYKKTNRMVGFKPAGGISFTNEALVYLNIVKTTLGEKWLNNNYFRIGASRLANNLLTDITGLVSTYF